MWRSGSLFAPLKLDGRDIGKIKREGYLRGTKAYKARLIFVGTGLAVSILVGVVAVLRKGSTFDRRVMSTILEWEGQYKDHLEKVKEVEAKQVLRTREKLRDDDI